MEKEFSITFNVTEISILINLLHKKYDELIKDYQISKEDFFPNPDEQERNELSIKKYKIEYYKRLIRKISEKED